ncbi:hypothetical protein Aspvir_009168 [Aspergillus viridinutans]|uniref:Uncharacterized protein n=1 Tax=Aspergillus viridinutans TaxID=75553 RepID=A0A9P3F4R7_ASPVI|nr:uncharacterized protein Aspvir_009168 [Aspergillus viridinutans]GIK05069.1 hypothetical protein Aspvir_009168 [Aspergillus viridinutans]
MPLTRAQSRTAVQCRELKPISGVPESDRATPRKRKAQEEEEVYGKGRKQKHRPPSESTSIPRSGIARKKSAKEQAKALDAEMIKHRARTNSTPMIQKIDKLMAEYGDLPLTDVGIPSPNKPTPDTILSHILNALLSCAHISHHIARRALLNLMKQGYYDLKTLKASTWKERVALLDEAGYARYDFSTATELGKLATLVKNKYGNVPLRMLIALNSQHTLFALLGWTLQGVLTFICISGSDISRILPLETDAESGRKLLKERLKEIKGIGPLGIEIFISTVQGLWPSLCPFLGSRDLQVAEQIGLGKDANTIYELLDGNPEQMAKMSVALTKIRLEKHIKEFLE